MSQAEQEYPRVFTQVDFMPGAERLLKHLNANNIPCCIASSSKRSTFEMKTKKFGDKFKPGYYFEHIVLASDDPDVKRSKPWPDTFLVAMGRFQDQPNADQCLVFEDSVAGAIGGYRAKMQTVCVPDPRLDLVDARHREPDFQPTIVIKSLVDFQPELFGMPCFEED